MSDPTKGCPFHETENNRVSEGSGDLGSTPLPSSAREKQPLIVLNELPAGGMVKRIPRGTKYEFAEDGSVKVGIRYAGLVNEGSVDTDGKIKLPYNFFLDQEVVFPEKLGPYNARRLMSLANFGILSAPHLQTLVDWLDDRFAGEVPEQVLASFLGKDYPQLAVSFLQPLQLPARGLWSQIFVLADVSSGIFQGTIPNWPSNGRCSLFDMQTLVSKDMDLQEFGLRIAGLENAVLSTRKLLADKLAQYVVATLEATEPEVLKYLENRLYEGTKSVKENPPPDNPQMRDKLVNASRGIYKTIVKLRDILGQPLQGPDDIKRVQNRIGQRVRSESLNSLRVLLGRITNRQTLENLKGERAEFYMDRTFGAHHVFGLHTKGWIGAAKSDMAIVPLALQFRDEVEKTIQFMPMGACPFISDRFFRDDTNKVGFQGPEITSPPESPLY